MNTSFNTLDLKQVVLGNSMVCTYIETGSGPKTPVIFLHGYADSCRSFERLLERFPEGYPCFAMDFRGHGDASKPDCCYRAADFVEDIRLFLAALEIDRAVIVGHSMGSFIAQIFAASYPMKTEKLILISSSTQAAGNQILQEIEDDIMGLEDPVDEAFIREFQMPSLPVPEKFMQKIIAESKKVPARVWKTVFMELLAMDNRDILGRIKAPTLILWGESDGIFQRHDQTLLTTGIKDTTFIEYEAGHALHWEIPETIFVDISRFLEES